jgi:hypothetical protein
MEGLADLQDLMIPIKTPNPTPHYAVEVLKTLRE